MHKNIAPNLITHTHVFSSHVCLGVDWQWNQNRQIKDVNVLFGTAQELIQADKVRQKVRKNIIVLDIIF